jgi:hypothetical protein
LWHPFLRLVWFENDIWNISHSNESLLYRFFCIFLVLLAFLAWFWTQGSNYATNGHRSSSCEMVLDHSDSWFEIMERIMGIRGVNNN